MLGFEPAAGTFSTVRVSAASPYVAVSLVLPVFSRRKV